MAMHKGSMRSPRLRRVAAVLADGKEHSSLAIQRRARVCAPGTCVSELRANGAVVECRQETRPSGRVWLYRMTTPPAEPVETTAKREARA